MAITDDFLKNKSDEIQDEVDNSDDDYEEESEESEEEESEEEDDDDTEEESDEEPSPKRRGVWQPYSMAAERNAFRREQQIRDGEYIPELDDPLKSRVHVPKVLTKEELEAKKLRALELAAEINACALRIQEALCDESEELDEATALEQLESFCCMPITPLSLTYSPSMLLTLKMCKAYTENPELQIAAKRGYDKCTVLFPFHITSSFEAVYIKSVKKVSDEEEFGAELMEGILEELEEALFVPDPLDDYDDSVLLEDWF